MFSTTDHYSNSMAAIIRPPQLVMERGGAAAKWKYGNAGSEIAPNCPRCASSNTKFCYYNNYSLSQPRYFCKGCRRYWTKGGSLRNVPVGGGCRKSRRSRAARHPGSAPLPDPSPDAPGGGACIDMAAVFAKYVNPGDNDESRSSFSPGDSSGSSENVQTSAFDSDCQLEDAVMAFEQREPLDSFSAGEDRTVMPQMSTCWEITGEGFGVHQEGVLSEDIMWSEGTTPLPNFPLVQVEDCGLFTPDNDHLRIPANLVSDNWGSFDLSSYDFYSNL